MMGQKDFTPKLFHSLSLSKLVPEGHLVRSLEEVLDLGFVWSLCRPYYSHTGQPSVDPIVIFKMMLLGYFYGITSERRLAEECSLHLAFRWYLGYDLDEATPNHSVLSKARSRYGKEVFEKFFEHVLRRCVEAGLVEGERIFADSTLIDADASVRSLVDRDSPAAPKHTPQQYVERVFLENPLDEKSTSRAAKSAALRAGSVEAEISQRKREWRMRKTNRGRKPGGRKNLNRQKISTTDPDASVVTRLRMKTKLAYKSHFTVDGRQRIITAVGVTPAAIEDSTQVVRLLDRQPVSPKFFCADSHYGVAPIYEELRRRGIVAIIPRRSSHTQKPKPGRLSPADFEYDAEKDVYRCPEGKKLKRRAYDAHWDRYHYRPLKSDCEGCSLRLACSTPRSVKTILRSPYEEAIEWGHEQLRTEAGQQVAKQRKTTAEWVVAEGKNFHGLRRAQQRGIEKVSVQVLMTATVQNLKRLMRSGSTNLLRFASDLVRLLLYRNFALALAAISHRWDLKRPPFWYKAFDENDFQAKRRRPL